MFGQDPRPMRPGDSLSEEDEEDTVQYVRIKKPKAPVWPPRSVRIGYDVINGVQSAVNPLKSGYEFTSDIDFARFLFTFDAGTYGNGVLNTDSLNNFEYSINGQYYRFGIAGNMLSRDKEGNIFAFILKRGYADFTDSLRVRNFDTNWLVDKEQPEDVWFSNQNMHVQWYELNISLKTKIWKSFWMGYEAGLKFRIRYQTDRLRPFFIPGYGKSENISATNSTWGFNYHLIYYIPFKRAKDELSELGDGVR